MKLNLGLSKFERTSSGEPAPVMPTLEAHAFPMKVDVGEEVRAFGGIGGRFSILELKFR
jgi:hypothetical protein